MNATERARRSDSLYYDTTVTNRRALCDMIANLESDLSGVKAENAKLRELAHLVAEYVSADQCEGCVTKSACNAGELDMCWIRKAILEKLRELTEVDG